MSFSVTSQCWICLLVVDVKSLCCFEHSKNRIIRATDVLVQGDVTIGACCVLHPQCRIVAEEGGKIIIGSHNMIEDQCVIRCSKGKTITIGNHNILSVGTQILDSEVRIQSDQDVRCDWMMGSRSLRPPKSLIRLGATIHSAQNVKLDLVQSC